jgi:hypothetical protein
MNRSDWEAVRDALIADDRERLGEPPTVEELLAYENGELSAREAERVRQLLIAYPELGSAFAVEFPPDVDDVRNGRVLLFWRSISAIAAGLAIAFGALLWQAHRSSLTPRVLPEPTILTPDGRRGAAEPPQAKITASGETILLVVSIVGPIDYDTYRLELVDGSAQRVWSSGPLPRTESNSFNLAVPARRLRGGTYQVVAYGVRGNAEEKVATYTIEVRR